MAIIAPAAPAADPIAQNWGVDILTGWPVPVSREVHHAAQRHPYEISSLVLPVWAILPKGRYGYVYQGGIYLLDAMVVQAQVAKMPGAKGLNQEIERTSGDQQ